MIGQMVLRNVIHRPLRTLVSVLAVAVEVTLVIVIVGLTSGMVQETAKRIEGVGADVMLQPPSASVFLAFSGAPMPIRIGDRLRQLKYVQAVAPVLLQFNSTGGIDLLYGIDPESFRAVSGGFVFLQGHDMTGPDDVLVDDFAARSKNMRSAAPIACWITISTLRASSSTARERASSCRFRRCRISPAPATKPRSFS